MVVELVIDSEAAVSSIKPYSASEAVEAVVVEDISTVVSGGSEEDYVFLDATYTRDTGGTYDNEFRVASPFPVRIENDTPDVVEVHDDGRAARLEDGEARLLCTTPRGRVSVRRSVVRQTDIAENFKEFNEGTLAYSMTNSIDSRLVGKVSDDIKIFSTVNSTTNIWVRNTSCWAADIDLTCVNARYSANYNMTGCLVTPRHMLFAGHWGPNGDPYTLKFVTNTNEVIDIDVSGRQNMQGDLTVIRLAEDVPSGITPAKLFPANLLTYLPHLSSNFSYYYEALPANKQTFPIIHLDQSKKARVNEMRFAVSSPLGDHTSSAVSVFDSVEDLKEHRQPFYEDTIEGDSSSPMFAVVGNEAVLLGVTTTTIGGIFVPAAFDSINTVIDSLVSGYEMVAFDLSGFPSYED